MNRRGFLSRLPLLAALPLLPHEPPVPKDGWKLRRVELTSSLLGGGITASAVICRGDEEIHATGDTERDQRAVAMDITTDLTA